MQPKKLLGAASRWIPFAARTAAFGTVSCVLGPLTRDRRASLWAMRAWCRSSARALDLRIATEGLEHVPEGPFVYASNHLSVLDILVLGAVLPGDFKWAAKRSLMRIPFLGWHLRLAGHVPVDRSGGPRAAVETSRRFEAVLRGGKPLLVFPEGTRSPDGSVRPFKAGAFHAAVNTLAPVVPVALVGTHQLMQKGALDARVETHTPVRVAVGAPIYPAKSGPRPARIEDMRRRTEAAVRALSAEISGAPRPAAARPAAPPPRESASARPEAPTA